VDKALGELRDAPRKLRFPSKASQSHDGQITAPAKLKGIPGGGRRILEAKRACCVHVGAKNSGSPSTKLRDARARANTKIDVALIRPGTIRIPQGFRGKNISYFGRKSWALQGKRSGPKLND